MNEGVDSVGTTKSCKKIIQTHDECSRDLLVQQSCTKIIQTHDESTRGCDLHCRFFHWIKGQKHNIHLNASCITTPYNLSKVFFLIILIDYLNKIHSNSITSLKSSLVFINTSNCVDSVRTTKSCKKIIQNHDECSRDLLVQQGCTKIIQTHDESTRGCDLHCRFFHWIKGNYTTYVTNIQDISTTSVTNMIWLSHGLMKASVRLPI
ncbi:unnamed protein product [Lupinus luteus]|uniref:Uncharacterized protein n=1 Tax=Lupinus luteus TaxID=3873 RepID=A0AAV1XQV0_LUPLU